MATKTFDVVTVFASVTVPSRYNIIPQLFLKYSKYSWLHLSTRASLSIYFVDEIPDYKNLLTHIMCDFLCSWGKKCLLISRKKAIIDCSTSFWSTSALIATIPDSDEPIVQSCHLSKCVVHTLPM